MRSGVSTAQATCEADSGHDDGGTTNTAIQYVKPGALFTPSILHSIRERVKHTREGLALTHARDERPRTEKLGVYAADYGYLKAWERDGRVKREEYESATRMTEEGAQAVREWYDEHRTSMGPPPPVVGLGWGRKRVREQEGVTYEVRKRR